MDAFNLMGVVRRRLGRAVAGADNNLGVISHCFGETSEQPLQPAADQLSDSDRLRRSVCPGPRRQFDAQHRTTSRRAAELIIAS